MSKEYNSHLHIKVIESFVSSIKSRNVIFEPCETTFRWKMWFKDNLHFHLVYKPRNKLMTTPVVTFTNPTFEISRALLLLRAIFTSRFAFALMFDQTKRIGQLREEGLAVINKWRSGYLSNTYNLQKILQYRLDIGIGNHKAGMLDSVASIKQYTAPDVIITMRFDSHNADEEAFISRIPLISIYNTTTKFAGFSKGLYMIPSVLSNSESTYMYTELFIAVIRYLKCIRLRKEFLALNPHIEYLKKDIKIDLNVLDIEKKMREVLVFVKVVCSKSLNPKEIQGQISSHVLRVTSTVLLYFVLKNQGIINYYLNPMFFKGKQHYSTIKLFSFIIDKISTNTGVRSVFSNSIKFIDSINVFKIRRVLSIKKLRNYIKNLVFNSSWKCKLKYDLVFKRFVNIFKKKNFLSNITAMSSKNQIHLGLKEQLSKKRFEFLSYLKNKAGLILKRNWVDSMAKSLISMDRTQMILLLEFMKRIQKNEYSGYIYTDLMKAIKHLRFAAYRLNALVIYSYSSMLVKIHKIISMNKYKIYSLVKSAESLYRTKYMKMELNNVTSQLDEPITSYKKVFKGKNIKKIRKEDIKYDIDSDLFLKEVHSRRLKKLKQIKYKSAMYLENRGLPYKMSEINGLFRITEEDLLWGFYVPKKFLRQNKVFNLNIDSLMLSKKRNIGVHTKLFFKLGPKRFFELRDKVLRGRFRRLGLLNKHEILKNTYENLSPVFLDRRHKK